MAEERGPAGPRFLFLGRPASPVFYNKLRTSVLSVITEMMGTEMRARIGRIDGSLGCGAAGAYCVWDAVVGGSNPPTPTWAGVAQLAAQPPCKRPVVGSSPIISFDADR